MAVDDTKVSDTPDEPGANAADTAGTTDTGTKPGAAGSGAGAGERTFTQAEVNAIVQRRLADQERALVAKHKEALDAQIETVRNETLADLETQVEARVTAKAAELQLAATRAEIQKARGLSDKQVARLQGTTPEELGADAVEVFGELPTDEEPETKPDDAADADKPARKKAPKIGGGGGQGSGLDITKMSPAEIRKHAKDLWPKRT